MLIININMALRHLLNAELIFIVIIILSTSTFAKSDTEVKYNALNDYDINDYLIPSHYDVKIKFDAYENVFSGHCYIKIQIVRPTKNIIIINSKIFALKLLKIDLINYDNNQSINIQKYCFINNTYILDFTQLSVDFLSPGRYILKIKYESTISDDGNFVGESFYTDEEEVLNNESIIIKASQLFPCLYGTVFESTINISIKHHKNYKLLSNIPIYKKVDDLNNMLWTQFYTSSMSTEHLTFVVTTFNYELIPFSTKANVKFWRREEITEQMRYAEIVVHRVVQYLIQKTTRRSPKIDYIVIKNFQYNMKTQGFILLREEDVIYNNTLDHIARKMEVANLIARETISHWYDDVFLWSKDGFIAFLAAHILDQTELYRIDLFVVQTLQESLRFDTLPLSSYAYNSIVHSFRTSLHFRKSSVIWRMLYNLISDNVFWTGVNRCVNTQYDQTNATNNDLLMVFWTAMESALNETNNTFNFNIKHFTDTIIEIHYPILYVASNYTHNLTIIKYLNFEHALLYNTSLYQIYVTYTTKSIMNFQTSNNNKSFWLSPLQPSYFVSKNNSDWIIVNLQQAGYYRVKYDVDDWRKLDNYMFNVNHTHIPVSNRAQIVDDAFYFMMLGQLNFNLFLDIVSFLVEDTDYIAWYPMIKAVEYMTCIWEIQDSIFAKDRVKNMFSELLLNIGYDDKFNESDFTKCLREEAVKWACVLDVFQCKTAATLQLEKHLESSVQDEVLKWKEWVYCKGLMAANFNTWQKVLNKWNTTSDNTILEYLTCSTDPVLILFYLEFIRLDHLYWKILNDKAIANILLLLIAKHARNDEVLNYIFNHLELFHLSRNRQVDEIAVLIVIITHEHDPNQFQKIIEFVKNNSTISSKRLVDFVEQKKDKRKKEYAKKIVSYRLIKK